MVIHGQIVFGIFLLDLIIHQHYQEALHHPRPPQFKLSEDEMYSSIPDTCNLNTHAV